MMSEAKIFQIGEGGKLVAIDSTSLRIGQRVEQAYKTGIATVCKAQNHGYLIIFDDGDFSDGQQVNSLSPYTRITEVDEPDATPEEVDRLFKLKDEKTERERVERTDLAKQKASNTESLITELRAKYSWANQDSSIGGRVRASKNIKIELARAFPGVKFSVKSSSFSGGNSIDIHWTLGPTSEEVKAITDKYQDGHFDGMDDSHHYDNSSFGEAIDIVLGRAKYVMESRSFPPELYEQVGKDLCQLQGIEYQGQYTNGLCGKGDSFDLGSHVNQLLSRSSFKPGENYLGVEHTPDEESQSVRDWCRIIKSKPAIKPVEAQEISSDVKIDGAITITENHEKDGIELRFAEKPSRAVLDLLKSNGWRWSSFNKCWYTRASDEAREFAYKINLL
jgi:hypothetical protein